MRSITPFLVLFLAACAPEPEIEETEPTPLRPGDRPDSLETVDPSEVPDAAIFDDALVQDGLVFTVTGTAWDEQQPADTLTVVLASDLSGELWVGSPEADGTWAWQGELEPGLQELSVRVEDDDGHVHADAIELEVVPQNRPPACLIESPIDGSHYAADEPVPLAATWDDPDADEVRLMWTSSISGPLFMGEAWDPVLPPGTHLITLEGDDRAGGSCVDEVTVVVGSARL